ncbi:MAG: hypothetical protein RIS79_2082 [Verrucomicrobiota bacterium]
MASTTFHLNGFTADQPLGFLAAVGLLRALDRAAPNWKPRLHWRQLGFWRAVISVEDEAEFSDVVDRVVEALDSSRNEIEALVNGLDLNLSMDRAEMRRVLGIRSESADGRLLQRMVSELPERDSRSSVSLLQMLNGAGRQDYLTALSKLARDTGRAHLEKTLGASVWEMSDEARGGLTLRLDAMSDCSHALQACDPNDMDMTSELAANRLAMEALGLFPCYPSRYPTTLGFHRRWRETLLRWPVWKMPLQVSELVGLTGIAEMADPLGNRAMLKALGVELVYESERRVVGKGKTLFSPSNAIPL